MLKQLSITLSVLILAACNDTKQDVNLQQDLKNDTTAKAIQIMFAEPQIIDSSHFIIYPLIFERTSYEGYGSSSRGEETSYWNLIFYNTETAQQHLLIPNKKILIYSINLSSSSSSSSVDIWKNGINIFDSNIIYTAVSKDYNLNNQLDQFDPNYIFVSDKEGNSFRQISPEDYNISSWDVVKGTSKIIMQGQKDANGDKKFDANDTTIPLIVDLTTMKPAVETFNSSYIDTVKEKLVTIWKPLKK
jgi:hypothetical protein